MKRFGLVVISLVYILVIYQCQPRTKKAENIKIVFYNVENLFDTIDSPDTEDSEFLPDSRLNWDTEKVNKKIQNLTKVLLSIDSITPPEIIGLCEVENRGILEDLINHSELNKHNYNIIHKESPDFRGIDVAMIYKADFYTPIESEWIEIKFPFDERTTRDILYSKGNLKNGEMIHIFVNHWTSRWGGREVTEPKRIYLAELIKSRCDDILANEPKANIIIIGDLNDNPNDISLMEGLESQKYLLATNPDDLYNLSLAKYENGEGTLYWKSWDFFDQMIVSGNMLAESSDLKVIGNTHYIFKEDWMLFTDNKGNKRPSRSASSGRYYGGYSDHLPVWLELELR